jgi:RNA polymerase sigma factor (sigma-70 family)
MNTETKFIHEVTGITERCIAKHFNLNPDQAEECQQAVVVKAYTNSFVDGVFSDKRADSIKRSIKQYIKTYLNAEEQHNHIPIDKVANTLSYEPDWVTDIVERDALETILAEMPEKYSNVLKCAFGIDCEPMSIQEMSKKYNITNTGVAYKVHRAINSARRIAREHKISI